MTTAVSQPLVTTGVPGTTAAPTQPTSPTPTGNAAISTGFVNADANTGGTNVAANYSMAAHSASTLAPQQPAPGGGLVNNVLTAAREGGIQSFKDLLGFAGQGVSNARRHFENLLAKARTEGRDLDPAEVALAQTRMQEATLILDILSSMNREERSAIQTWLRG